MLIFTCEHCRNGSKLYPAGTHNIGKGTWVKCADVTAIRAESEDKNWKFAAVATSERSAKALLTKYRNRNLAAGWNIGRGFRKFYAIFTAEVL